MSLPRPARATAVHLGLTLLAFASGGCGGDDDPPVSRTVLVVDDGFDVSAAPFAGKIVGQYTVECRAAGPQTTGPAADPAKPESFDSTKAAALAELALADDGCGLRMGISPKPDPFPEVAGLRARWNGLVQNSRYGNQVFSEAEFNRVTDAFEQNLKTAAFHGTATAGVIARDNPGVRLVLVERPLGSVEELMKRFTCLDQREVDLATAVLLDADVRAAYVARPRSRWERDTDSLFADHAIELVNESFGLSSRQALEALQKMKGCAPVSLRAFYAAQATLDQAREAMHPGPAALVVRAAGNQSSTIDGPEDAADCYERSNAPLTIGSYGVSGTISDFTNQGRCVDAFAPGESIIAPLPGGWWLPLDGTSFSAPLVTRLLSMDEIMGPLDPASTRSHVLNMRDQSQRIPRSRFPKNINYDPAREGASYALRLEGYASTSRRAGIDIRALHETLRLLALGAGRPR